MFFHYYRLLIIKKEISNVKNKLECLSLFIHQWITVTFLSSFVCSCVGCVRIRVHDRGKKSHILINVMLPNSAIGELGHEWRKYRIATTKVLMFPETYTRWGINDQFAMLCYDRGQKSHILINVMLPKSAISESTCLTVNMTILYKCKNNIDI